MKGEGFTPLFIARFFSFSGPTKCPFFPCINFFYFWISSFLYLNCKSVKGFFDFSRSRDKIHPSDLVPCSLERYTCNLFLLPVQLRAFSIYGSISNNWIALCFWRQCWIQYFLCLSCNVCILWPGQRCSERPRQVSSRSSPHLSHISIHLLRLF